MNFKAMVKLTDDWRSMIPAQVIGTVPSGAYDHEACASGPTYRYGTRAQCILLSFDRGQVVELPWPFVRIVADWPDGESVEELVR